MLVKVTVKPSEKQQKSDTDLINSIDAFVSAQVEKRGIPGLSVAIIKDNKRIFSKGWGIKSIDRIGEPNNEMTADTPIVQCSLSKSFVAGAISILVNQKKLEWNTPLKTFVPDLEFSDEYVTNNINLLDLLSHRSGFLGNLRAFSSNHGYLKSSDQLFESLKHLEMSKDFRNSYVYSNYMYVLLSIIIEKVSGVSFYEFVKVNIFEPLGMNARYEVEGDSAEPHDLDYSPEEFLEAYKGKSPEELFDFKPKLCVIPRYNCYQNGAPGGIVCSANDMAKWIQCLMNDGKAEDGTQVIYDVNKVLTKVHNAQNNQLGGVIKFVGDGCGLVIDQIDKYRIIRHTGGLPGITTYLTYTNNTDLKLGLYVGSNSKHHRVALDALFYALATFLHPEAGKPLMDSVLTHKAPLPGLASLISDIEKYTQGDIKIHPRFDDFMGEYTHPAYGLVTITKHEKEGYLFMTREPEVNRTLYPIRQNQHNLNPSALSFYEDSGKFETYKVGTCTAGSIISWNFVINTDDTISLVYKTDVVATFVKNTV
ncbi:beta-lactamase/transpeptidase-like protein [Globomyces pollinis-pini]|nr:beta-lactamase/transpeptidase-like protein [Globomyces pollinis-pini]